MESEECLLLDCPRCGIMISVKVEDVRNATRFQCPICAKEIGYDFPPEVLDRMVEESKAKQARELKKAFRLSFGDI